MSNEKRRVTVRSAAVLAILLLAVFLTGGLALAGVPGTYAGSAASQDNPQKGQVATSAANGEAAFTKPTWTESDPSKVVEAVPDAPAAPEATSNYVFATSTSASLVDMSTGTTQLLGANIDDTASTLTNIGFDFYFQGARFTQFSINENGVLRLGAAAQAGSPYQPLAQAGISILTAYGADQRTHLGDGKVHFKVTGTAPNRVLNVEWLNMQSTFNTGGTADLTYQVRLSETTGVIEYIYGSMTMSTLGAADTNSNDPQIGFSSGSTAGTVGSVAAPQSGVPAPTYDGSSATPTNNLYNTAGPITVLTSASQGSRRNFTFTPPVPTAPTGLNFTNIAATSMQLNWTDSPNELLYLIYRSTDGVNYTFITTLAAGTTTYNATGLTFSTTYFWNVYAVSEGALSTPLSGSQSTAPAGNISSTAAGGLWSAPSTWVGGVVPTSGDNVTIVNSAVVTIDIAASALSLTINSGATLQYESAVARTLTVGTFVTIDSGGVFQTAATGTVIAHVLSVGTDLTNNGTLDFSTNTNTSGAGITFTGAANNTFGGSGATTDIRALTVNKGTSNVNILELTVANFTVQGVNTNVAGFLTLTNGTFKISGTFTMTNRVFISATYTIATTAGFWLNNPNFTVSAQAGGTTSANNGLWRITQGVYNIGVTGTDGFGGGTGAVFIVEGGTINATRFDPQNAVSYTQSGGVFNVGVVANTRSSFGTFELFSTASSFTMSGGVINLVQASVAATPIDWQVRSTAFNYTSGTLNVGTAATTTNFNFRILANVPSLVVDNTTNNKTATFAGQTLIYGNVLINPGTTYNLNGFLVALLGNTITNNGTILGSTAGSRFYFLKTAAGAQTYTGSGTAGSAAAPLVSVDVDSAPGLVIDPSVVNPIFTLRVILFTGNITGANKLTLGGGAATTATVQIGNTTTPTAAGTFDVAPNFNLGTGGQVMIYLRTTTPRTTGPEINPTRILTSLTYDNNNPAHALTIAGGDITVSSTATALTLTNGRIVTGANTLIVSSGTGVVVRTNGYVDGNLRKVFVANAVKLFELGTLNGYSPMTTTVTAGTFPADFTAKAVQGPMPSIFDPSVALQRYWTLTATGITADLRFRYLDPTDIMGNEANYVVFKYDGALTQPGGTVDTANNEFTVPGVTSFSDWTLAEPSGGNTPTATNTSISTATDTSTSTSTSTNTATSTDTATPTNTATDTATNTVVPPTSTSTTTSTSTASSTSSSTATIAGTATCTAGNVQLILDPSFETGIPNAFWDETSTNFGTPLCDVPSCGTGGGTSGPRTGSFWAWFGGIPAVEDASLAQTVIIPPGTATLQFYLWLGTHSGAGVSDYMRVLVGGTEVFQVTDADTAYNAGYTLVTLDISAFAGGSREIRFESHNGAATVTFSVEDVTVNSNVICATSTGTATTTSTNTGTATTTNTAVPPTLTATITSTRTSTATATATVVSCQVVTSGSITVDDPTFQRPNTFAQNSSCTTSTTGASVHYDVHTYQLGTAGSVTASLCAAGGGSANFDSFVAIYQAPAGVPIPGFIPAGCVLAISANDDFCSSASQVSANLVAGTYYVVVTQYSTNTGFCTNGICYGDYTLAVSSAGACPTSTTTNTSTATLTSTGTSTASGTATSTASSTTTATITSTTVSGTATSTVCVPGAATWVAIATAPAPGRYNESGVVATDGKFHVYTGQDAANAPLASHELFDPTTNTWSSVSPVPSPVAVQPMLGSLGGKIFSVGGAVASTQVPVLNIYDIATNTYTTGAPAPVALRAAMGWASSTTNRFYVFGGVDAASAPLQSTLIYDPAANSWTTGANMPDIKFYGGAAEVGGLIYVYGGANATAFSNQLFAYDPVANTWTTLAPGPIGRIRLGFSARGGKLFAAGGSTTAGSSFAQTNTVDVYDIATNTWSAGPPMTIIRNTQAQGTLPDGRIIVAYGLTTGNTRTQSAEVLPPDTVCTTPTVTVTATGTATSTGTGTATSSVTATQTATGTASSTGTGTATSTSSSTSTSTASATNSSTSTSTTVPPTITSTNTTVPPTTTGTNTVVPPTFTSTSTTVPPTSTSTSTSTNTSTTVPPTTTSTSTSVPPTTTGTNTVVPPTFTGTSTSTTVPPTNTTTTEPSATNTTEPSATNTIEPSATPTLCVMPFTDTDPEEWFYGYVEWMYCNGVVNGYNTDPPCDTGAPCFKPGNTTTRGQMAKIVVLAFDFTIDTTGGPHFTDVPEGSTFYTFIETGRNLNLFSGYDDGTYRPANWVTRGQIAKIVVNGAILADPGSWSLSNPATNTFQDVPVGSDFFRYVETAYEHNVLSGYPCGAFPAGPCQPGNKPYYLPGANATRAQISKITYLAATYPPLR